jgi:hypothetical protein
MFFGVDPEQFYGTTKLTLFRHGHTYSRYMRNFLPFPYRMEACFHHHVTTMLSEILKLGHSVLLYKLHCAINGVKTLTLAVSKSFCRLIRISFPSIDSLTTFLPSKQIYGASGLRHSAREVDLAAFLPLGPCFNTIKDSRALFFGHNKCDMTRLWKKIYVDMLSSTVNRYGPNHKGERA